MYCVKLSAKHWIVCPRTVSEITLRVRIERHRRKVLTIKVIEGITGLDTHVVHQEVEAHRTSTQPPQVRGKVVSHTHLPGKIIGTHLDPRA
jgi:hypothetical protein